MVKLLEVISTIKVTFVVLILMVKLTQVLIHGIISTNVVIFDGPILLA